jgi:hypothetical protein
VNSPHAAPGFDDRGRDRGKGPEPIAGGAAIPTSLPERAVPGFGGRFVLFMPFLPLPKPSLFAAFLCLHQKMIYFMP